jgi:hypothetical protein
MAEGSSMNWLKKKLYNWITSSAYDDTKALCEGPSIGIGRSMSMVTSTLDSDRNIRFNVYKATGGTIVETSFYDRHKDRHNTSLHIITDDQDIGKEIGKIITMETLKQ